jgi:hypothetical protein
MRWILAVTGKNQGEARIAVISDEYCNQPNRFSKDIQLPPIRARFADPGLVLLMAAPCA